MKMVSNRVRRLEMQLGPRIDRDFVRNPRGRLRIMVARMGRPLSLVTSRCTRTLSPDGSGNGLLFKRSFALDEHVFTGSRIIGPRELITVLDRQGLVDRQLFPARVDAEYVHCCHSGAVNVSRGFCNQLRPVPMCFGLDRFPRVACDRVLGAVHFKRQRLTGDRRLMFLSPAGLDTQFGCILFDDQRDRPDGNGLMGGFAS
jgi:hypothetical protein